MRFNEVPVALVGREWLDTFLSKAAATLTDKSPSVVLMPTDSHRESEFLCSRLVHLLRTGKGKRAAELTVLPNDPTLLWESLFGLPDMSPRLESHLECDVLVLRGGNYIPKWFLDDFVGFLDAVADAFNVSILVPVSRAVAEDTETTAERLTIPSIADASKDEVKDYILWAIEELVPDLRDEGEWIDRRASREELCDLFLAEPPASRTRIGDALEFYNETFDSERYPSVAAYARVETPTIAGLRFAEPAPILEKCTLQAAFDSNLARILELNAPFLAETGYPLLSPTHAYSYPFDSSDPLHWFIGCVSYLGCIFFDAGRKTGLTWALQFEWQEAQFLRIGPPAFVQSLRQLRTWFQHNLNPDDKDDRKTAAFASAWFARAISVPEEFCRHNARRCLGALLREFSETVSRLVAVVSNLGTASEAVRSEMQRELDRISRTVAEHEVLAAINQVVIEQEINVDPDLVARKCQDRIIKDLKATSCRLDDLGSELVRICEYYCYGVARTPPSVGELMRKRGLQPREIGICMDALKKEWESDSTMTPEVYVARATEMANRIQSME